MTEYLKEFLIENKVLLASIGTSNPKCQKLFDNWAEYNKFPPCMRGNKEDFDLLSMLLATGISLDAILSNMDVIPATMFSYISGNLDLSNCRFNEIGSAAFKSILHSNCLREIILPKTLEIIGDYAFENCNELGKIEFNEGLKKIHSGAFRYCKYLTKIYLPDSLEEIEPNAFCFCDNLYKVSIPKKFEDQLTDIFYDKIKGSFNKGYTPILTGKIDFELR